MTTGELKLVSGGDGPSQPVNPSRIVILTTGSPTSVTTVLPTNIPVDEAYIPGKSTSETQTGISSVEAFPHSPKCHGPSDKINIDVLFRTR